MVRIGLKTEQGQEFFIDVPLEDIHNWELNLKEKIKVFFSRKKQNITDTNDSFMKGIWVATKVLNQEKEKLRNKITNVSAQEGADASYIFTQSDDRQKFEEVFGNAGGMNVSIDNLIELYNKMTEKGKSELNEFIKSK